MTYPLCAYNFIVEFDGMVSTAFTEVLGLCAFIDVVEHREGTMPDSSAIKLPGLSRFSNVTLKRGLTKGNNDLYNWFQSSRQKADRRSVAIKLLDEERNPVIIWLLKNAFPCKLQYTGLHALSNGLALEELELAYDSFTVETF